MGLFSQKYPKDLEKLQIEKTIEMLNDHYKWIKETDDLGAFLTGKGMMKSDIDLLLHYENKYPAWFKSKPSVAWQNILSEFPDVEKKFVNRYVISIERKLLNYSTIRGKRNNLNKMVDLFKYNSGEFYPQTVLYFEKMIKERFSNYS